MTSITHTSDTAASGAFWWIPSSAIAWKTMVSLCKSNSVLIYTRIARSFISTLQAFDMLQTYIRNRKTASRIAASEAYWWISSSPMVVGKKHVASVRAATVVRIVVVVKSGADRKQRRRKEVVGGGSSSEQNLTTPT